MAARKKAARKAKPKAKSDVSVAVSAPARTAWKCHECGRVNAPHMDFCEGSHLTVTFYPPTDTGTTYPTYYWYPTTRFWSGAHFQ